MRISMDAVDWEAYLAAWQKKGESLMLSDGEKAGWLHSTPQTIENDSMIMNEEIGEAFGQIRHALPNDLAKTMHEFIGGFCLLDEFQDVPPPKDGQFTQHDVIVAVFSPESVRRYLARYETIEFNTVSNAFKQNVDTSENDGVENADEFIEYLELWGRTFREAAQTNRGMLLCVG